MTVNATELFEKRDPELEDDLGEDGDFSLPTLEVTEVSFAQTIECPMSHVDNVILSGKYDKKIV